MFYFYYLELAITCPRSSRRKKTLLNEKNFLRDLRHEQPNFKGRYNYLWRYDKHVLLNQRNFLLSLKALKTPIFFHFHRFTLRCALEIFFAVNIVLSIMFFVDERSYD